MNEGDMEEIQKWLNFVLEEISKVTKQQANLVEVHQLKILIKEKIRGSKTWNRELMMWDNIHQWFRTCARATTGDKEGFTTN